MAVHLDLSGHTALVTGASGGLGAHFSQTLAAAGAKVILGGRRIEALEDLAGTIAADGGEAVALSLDVSDASALAHAVSDAPDFDILVNNAGIVREAAAIAVTESDWDAVIDTNLKGMFLMAQAAARRMRETEGGSIINIASILGLRQGGGVIPYAVSKAGVIQMTKVLALEWARFNIRVNAIAPGYMATDLNRDFWATPAGQALIKRIPMHRLGEPSELDLPLLMFASGHSTYMTGTVVTVDGGHLVSTL
jgi:NAD(P)-dependent dehydrogenase (short-subunit alcohol dehydrogenase family)